MTYFWDNILEQWMIRFTSGRIIQSFVLQGYAMHEGFIELKTWQKMNPEGSFGVEDPYIYPWR